jgi:hypothetical protein
MPDLSLDQIPETTFSEPHTIKSIMMNAGAPSEKELVHSLKMYFENPINLDLMILDTIRNLNYKSETLKSDIGDSLKALMMNLGYSA